MPPPPEGTAAGGNSAVVQGPAHPLTATLISHDANCAMRHGAAQAAQDGNRAIAVVDLTGSYDHAYVCDRFHSAVERVAADLGASATAVDMAANNQNDV